MSFEEEIAEILLTSIKQSGDFDFFIDTIIEWNESQKADEPIDWFNSLVDNQNNLFLKIVHSHSITIFETFNEDFFKYIRSVKGLSKKHVSTTPSKILKFFLTNFNLNLEKEFKLWIDLKEAICRRNVIIHNMGRINEVYQDCANSKLIELNKMIGRDVPHDLEYVKRSNYIVGNYIIFIFKKIVEFYNLKDINGVVKKLADHPYYDEVNPDLLDGGGYIVRYKVEFIDDKNQTPDDK